MAVSLLSASFELKRSLDRTHPVEPMNQLTDMDDKQNLALAQLEDDVSLLEQHAKHVASLLGRRTGGLEERVTALQASSLLFQEIRQIGEKVHALRSE